MSENLHKGPIPLRELLSRREGGLAAILQHTSKLKLLQDRLRRELPAALAEHLTVADVTSRVLVIRVDNSSGAARLRFLIPELLTLVREKCSLPDIQTIRIKVDVTRDEPERVEKRIALTATASQCLSKSAQAISDPDLRKSLLKLSGHT